MTAKRATLSDAPFPIIGLAPLAGVSDQAFRRLCFRFGADFAVTEMVSAKGLYYHSEKTKDLMALHPEEGPVYLQLFGHEPEIFRTVIREQLRGRYDFVGLDLNMGCPAHKIIKNGDGAALMRTPLLAGQVISAMVEASDRPVSVKMRLGWDQDHQNYLEMGRIAQESGASLITLHGRTREAQYSGEADWTAIQALKESLSIPVIGNGDVKTPETALQRIRQTGVDGIALGRGAMGHPFLFQQIKDYEEQGRYEPVSRPLLIQSLQTHYQWEEELRGPHQALLAMRKHLASYLSGFPGVADLRHKLMLAQDQEGVFRLLDQWLSCGKVS